MILGRGKGDRAGNRGVGRTDGGTMSREYQGEGKTGEGDAGKFCA